MYVFFVHSATMVNSGLFPATRARVLAAVLLQPERTWHLRALARHLGLTPSSLQGELASLVAQGVLTRRREGRRVCFQADPDCPYHTELRGLIAKTAGIPDMLRTALQPLADRIDWAFVFGSIAAGTERADSDIDLFVIGEVSLGDLVEALSLRFIDLRRELNPILYDRARFLAQRNSHHFVRTVMSEPKLDVLGCEDAVARPDAGGKGEGESA